MKKKMKKQKRDYKAIYCRMLVKLMKGGRPGRSLPELEMVKALNENFMAEVCRQIEAMKEAIRKDNEYHNQFEEIVLKHFRKHKWIKKD